MRLELESLEKQKKSLIDYLLSKVTAGDWHAVQDAASDIREINVALKILYEQDAKRRE